jgi:hypothetical protein
LHIKLCQLSPGLLQAIVALVSGDHCLLFKHNVTSK